MACGPVDHRHWTTTEWQLCPKLNEQIIVETMSTHSTPIVVFKNLFYEIFQLQSHAKSLITSSKSTERINSDSMHFSDNALSVAWPIDYWQRRKWPFAFTVGDWKGGIQPQRNSYIRECGQQDSSMCPQQSIHMCYAGHRVSLSN